MNRHAQVAGVAFAVSLALLLPSRAGAGLFPVTDVDLDPNVFEAYLTADEQVVTVGTANNVQAMIYKDAPPALPSASAGIPGIPVPLIKVKVGDLVIAHLTNDLTTESTSIHWHGIELDNDSDGTAVSQDAVLPGQSYTYRFRIFRPGLFWFHPHMAPGSSTFAGMYGAIVVENDIEASLEGTTLPTDANTHELVLSDIRFDAVGVVGFEFPTGGPTLTVNELVELCHLNAEGDPAGSRSACGVPNLGDTILVNGEKPDQTAHTPIFTVASGQRVRLRLFDAAIARQFRLKLLGSGDDKLYRIGGEGGLLDAVRLEGGTQGSFDTLYDVGEIVLGSGDRADVIVVPSGAEGAIIPLVANSLLSPPFRLSGGLPQDDYPIAFFVISGTSTDSPPAPGDAILAGTPEDVENLKDDPLSAVLIDPAPYGGSSDETIRLTNGGGAGLPSVDGVSAMLDTNAGNGDFLVMQRPSTARYTYVGDLLELSVRNETDAVHPFHLHGFSMQPVRIVDSASNATLYAFDYDEFIDNIDVYPETTFVYRIRLDDRRKICDSSSASPGPVLAACNDAPKDGAIGRWLFHCHIFHHAGLGMMSELVVMRPTVTLCHNGNTIEVSKFAAPAHYAHGDTVGACSP